LQLERSRAGEQLMNTRCAPLVPVVPPTKRAHDPEAHHLTE